MAVYGQILVVATDSGAKWTVVMSRSPCEIREDMWVILTALGGCADRTSRTTTVAESLAKTYLARSEPAVARDIVERGLDADPINAALTEILMEAHADLGEIEAAPRVYESHDRSLGRFDLGGASNETRLVLVRLRANASISTEGPSEAAT